MAKLPKMVVELRGDREIREKHVYGQCAPEDREDTADEMVDNPLKRKTTFVHHPSEFDGY